MDQEEERKRVYADLLLQAVRRHTLLPSNVMKSVLRNERSSFILERPAIFSSRPLLVTSSKMWFACLSFVLMILSMYNVVSARFDNRDIFASVSRRNGGDTNYRWEEGGVQFVLEINAVQHQALTESLAAEASGRPIIAGISMIDSTVFQVIECTESTRGSLSPDPNNATRVRLTYFKGFAPPSLHGWRLVPGQGFAMRGVDLELYQEFEAGERIIIDRRWNVSFEPGKAIDFSLETPWPLYFVCMGWALTAALFGGFVVLKALKRTTWSNLNVYIFGLAIAFNSLYAGVSLEKMSGNWAGYGVHLYKPMTDRFIDNAITEILAVFAFVLIPRFPDVPMIIIGVGLLVVGLGTEKGGLDSSPARTICMVLIVLAGFSILVLRVTLSLLSLLTLRRQRKKLGKVWQSVLASEPNSGAALIKIDTIVKRIEASIPKDAQARQLQLRPQSGPATRSQKLWDFLLEVSGQVSTRNTRVLGRYPSTTLGTLAQINRQNMGLLVAHETGKEFAPDISKAADNFLLPLLGSENEEGNHDLEARLTKKLSEFNSRANDHEDVMVASCSPGLLWTIDIRRPITSLDQLWTQATLARGSLLPKVLDLASRFNGMFPLRRDPSSAENSKRVQFGKCPSRVWQTSKGMFEMGQIKLLGRATQKADTAYAGDVSRLLDVCRERIVFEKLQDLADCLQAVRDDEEFIIVRIKSSMGKSGIKPVINSGLGFISINLMIDNNQTRKLAIHTHVCELQFTLKGFAETISRSSHSDYIRARNTWSVFQLRWSPLHNTVYDTYKRFRSLMQKINAIAPEDTGISVSTSRRMSLGQGQNASRKVSLSESQNAPSHGSRDSNQLVGLGSSSPEVSAIKRTPSLDVRRDRTRPTGIFSSPSSSPISQLVSAAAPIYPPGMPRPIADPSTLSGASDENVPGGSENGGPYDLTVEPVGGEGGGGGGGGVAEEESKWKTSWKVEFDEEDIVQLECICRLSALGLNEHIDNNLTNLVLTKGIGKAMATNIVFTTKRLLFTMSSAAQVVLTLIGIICVYFGVRQTIYDANPTYRHFMFVSLSDGTGKSDPSTPGVADFGIQHKTHGTCIDISQIENMPPLASEQYSDVARKRFDEGNTITISFAQHVPMTGWFIKTLPGGSLNTSNFVIHASNFEGVGRWDSTEADSAVPDSEWVELATPGWMDNQMTWIRHRNFGKLDYDKNMTIIFEPALLSGNTFESSANNPFLIYGILLLNFALFGFLKMPQHGTKVMVIFLFVLMYTSSSRIPLESAHGQVQAFFAISKPAVLMLMAISNPFFLVPMSLTTCAFLSFGQVAYMKTVQLPFGPQFVNIGVPWLGLVIIVYMISMEFAKMMTRKWGNYIVKDDMERYHELWQAEVEKDTGQLTLNHLAEVVKMLGLDESSMDSRKRFKQAIFRQTNRKFLYLDGSHSKLIKKTDIAPSFTRAKCLGEDLVFEMLNCMAVPNSVDKDSFVQSYNQLYIQALLIHSPLRKKVIGWALQSQGHFALVEGAAGTGGSRFVKCSDAMSNPALAAAIKWPKLKRFNRGFEKLARVYNGDVSRLSDVCRFSLYFDTFTDLTQALGIIVTDTDIKVERVKCRLSVKFDASHTAGYRDIMLNLKISNDHICALGCETHACEVQLVLRSFGELRTASGHNHYVLFRDIRGE